MHAWTCPFCILRGLRKFLNFNIHVFLLLKIDFILANNAGLDEMPHYAAFHLGLHCLPKYMSTGIQFDKG